MSLRDSLARDIKKALHGACELALDIPLGLLHQYARTASKVKHGMQSAEGLPSQQFWFTGWDKIFEVKA